MIKIYAMIKFKNLLNYKLFIFVKLVLNYKIKIANNKYI